MELVCETVINAGKFALLLCNATRVILTKPKMAKTVTTQDIDRDDLPEWWKEDIAKKIDSLSASFDNVVIFELKGDFSPLEEQLIVELLWWCVNTLLLLKQTEDAFEVIKQKMIRRTEDIQVGSLLPLSCFTKNE
jgi:hypothetical protein